MVNYGIQKYEGENICHILLDCINRYWFIFAILLYYPIYYLIFKKNVGLRLYYILIVFTLIYIFVYILCLNKFNGFFVELTGFSPFKILFYLIVFITGGLLKNINYNISKNKPYIYLAVILSFIVWSVEYYLVLVLETFYVFQLLIQISTLSFSVFLLLLFKNFEEKIKTNPVIKIISDSTLEIYLTQVTFKFLIINMSFPINYTLFWTLAIIGGITIHLIYSWRKTNA